MTKINKNGPCNLFQYSGRSMVKPMDSPQLEVSGTSTNGPNAENDKVNRHHTGIQEKRYANEVYMDIFRQIEAEIEAMEDVLRKVQKKKKDLGIYICQFMPKKKGHSVSKFRKLVLANAPQVFTDSEISAVIYSEKRLITQVLASSGNICADSPKYDIPSLKVIAPIKSIYDSQLEHLISPASKSQSYSKNDFSKITSFALQIGRASCRERVSSPV